MLGLLLTALIAVVQPSPTATPAQSPAPSPVSTPLREIVNVLVGGRDTNLVGHADAASAGTIDRQQITTTPLLRPAELLQVIPGLVITQHSGEGKANQYYLRGFQLDHGTDLAATIAGIPVNMPTHAHGQGYSDINWLMPETVEFVTFKKGSYYADRGDFSTAGSYDLYYKNSIPATLSLGAGDYGYDRLFVANSPKLGAGNLLYAFEAYHDDGTFVRPDDYKKLGGLLRYTRETPNALYAVTAQGYRGDFNSTDQIPKRLVDAGLLDRFGYVDPTDGGRTYRYALSTELQHHDSRGATRLTLYGVSYGLDLYSNFTYYQFDSNDYYNVTANPVTCNPLYTTCTAGSRHVSTYTSYCPANVTPTNFATVPRSITPTPFSYSCGDQRRQSDHRVISGFDVVRTLNGSRTESTFGVGLRNDNIYGLQLSLTKAQTPYVNGTLSNDHVVERDVFLYGQTQYKVGEKLRLIGGLRVDDYYFNVVDFQPANSGVTRESLLSPKFMAAYKMSPTQELYLDFGGSFHSNDGRGTTQTVDPQTHASIDPSGAPVRRYGPLVRAFGEELGYQLSLPKLTTTLTLWELNFSSELVFNGDHGVTTPSGPTVRKGVEFTAFYRPIPHLTLDCDFSMASARFTTNVDGSGTYVPESLNAVTTAGATFDRPTYSAGLRYTYFGPRTLDPLGAAASSPSNILNAQFTIKGRRGTALTLDVFNLLNSVSDDVRYSYGSWLPQDARNSKFANDPSVNPLLGGGGVTDYHFHPSERRIFRLTYAFRP